MAEKGVKAVYIHGGTSALHSFRARQTWYLSHFDEQNVLALGSYLLLVAVARTGKSQKPPCKRKCFVNRR